MWILAGTEVAHKLRTRPGRGAGSIESVSALSQFHPAVQSWFESRLGEPSAPQRDGWPLIRDGRNVLIAAPTGSGKTLAGFLSAIDELFQQGPSLPDETQVVYVSPLRALSNDIQKNLQGPLARDPRAGPDPARDPRAGAHRRHAGQRARGDDEAAAAHPGHDAGVPVPPADVGGRARDARHHAHA